MKKIIRYLLEGDGSVPKFVENGGYFPYNEELVGLSVDSSKRHLPVSVVVFATKQELVDWATQIGEPEVGTVEDQVDAWLSSVGYEYE